MTAEPALPIYTGQKRPSPHPYKHSRSPVSHCIPKYSLSHAKQQFGFGLVVWVFFNANFKSWISARTVHGAPNTARTLLSLLTQELCSGGIKPTDMLYVIPLEKGQQTWDLGRTFQSRHSQHCWSCCWWHQGKTGQLKHIFSTQSTEHPNKTPQ